LIGDAIISDMAHRLEATPAVTGELLDEVAQALGREPVEVSYVTSGAAGHIFRLNMRGGDSVILKTARSDRPAAFEGEAAGLRFLASTNTVLVPEVLAVGPHYLVLEDLGDPVGQPSDAAWETFGEQVGRMHAITGQRFGYFNAADFNVSRETSAPSEEHHPSVEPVETTASHNSSVEEPRERRLETTGDAPTWIDFYAAERIIPLFEYMQNPEVLTAEDRAGILRIIEKLGSQVPPGKPSLGHGDLWRENVHLGADGRLYLIDPALDFTHPEADLATSQMYEVFPPKFYEGYRKARPLDADWTDRLPLYQLKEILYMTGQFKHEPSIKLLRECIEKYQ